MGRFSSTNFSWMQISESQRAIYMWAFVVSPSFVLALRVLGISSFKKNQHFQIQRDLQSGYEEAAYVCVCFLLL